MVKIISHKNTREVLFRNNTSNHKGYMSFNVGSCGEYRGIWTRIAHGYINFNSYSVVA